MMTGWSLRAMVANVAAMARLASSRIRSAESRSRNAGSTTVAATAPRPNTASKAP